MLITFATIVAATLGLPLVVLGVECWLSLLPLRRCKMRATLEPRFVVVIPAHNEEDGIARTIQHIRQQVADNAEVFVIADNCSDNTAERARATGVVVWERFDRLHTGKGYALNFAWERLRQMLLDVVVYVDADCSPAPGCLHTIAQLSHFYQRPVQAAYSMCAPRGTFGLTSVSAFAVYIKNVVRPRGLQRVGFPCLLTGSGMAIPVKVLEAVPFPDGHVAEDTRISTDLAIAGFAPVPCMEASISSVLPERRSGFMSQRTRWEHGHIKTILTEVPKLLATFVRTRSWNVLALCLELFVPPLSLMVLGSAAFLGILLVICQVIGSWLPLFVYMAAVAIGASGLAAAWLLHCRSILPLSTALRIPEYVVVKAPMYLRFIHRRQRDWVRTERSTTIHSAGHDVVPPRT